MKAERLAEIKARAHKSLIETLSRPMDHTAQSRKDIKDLLAEVERLMGVGNRAEQRIEDLFKTIEFQKDSRHNLREENARLRKALEFYANEKSWQPNAVTMLTPMHYDYNGKLAREALQNGEIK